MNDNSVGFIHESPDIILENNSQIDSKEPSKDPPNLFILCLKTFFLQIIPIILLLAYSHLRAKDHLLSLLYITSVYLLIIFEIHSETPSQNTLNVKKTHIQSDFQPSISGISIISSQKSNTITLNQPLLSNETSQRRFLPSKKFIYMVLVVVTTLELMYRIGYLTAFLLDDSLRAFQAKNTSLFDFFNINFSKDFLVIFLEFLPDFLMLILLVLIMLWHMKKKPETQRKSWNFDKKTWELRLEALILLGLIFTPFLIFNLLGIPFILMTVSLLILHSFFLKWLLTLLTMLKIYIVFYVFSNHLANVPLIMDISAFDSLRIHKEFYGFDLYTKFQYDFYNFSLNCLLLILLILSCIYSRITRVEIEENPENLLSFLPILQQKRNFLSVISQEEKDTQEIVKKSFKRTLFLFFEKICNVFLDFFQSIETILRALQAYSIVIIMRYESIYPLGCLLWVFISGITINHKLLAKISGFLVIPLTTIQIIILYYSNIPNNTKTLENAKIFGFKDYSFEGFEYLFLMVYLILQMAYLSQASAILNIKSTSINKSKSNVSKASAVQEVTFLKIFRTLLYKNCYFLALFILFWISLYTVNLIHLILALFFVIFFLKTGTNSFILKSEADCKRNFQQKVITFQEKYWIYLVLYVDMVILIRHLWSLLIMQYYYSHLNSEYIDFIGLNYSYEINSFNFGFQEVDFGSNTIIWILFIFVVMQNNTYKSKFFKTAPNMMLMLKDFQPIQGRIYRFLEAFIRWIYIIYYKSILWVGYLAMITLLLFEPIDLINTVLLLIILIGFVWHLFTIQAKNIKNTQIYRFWLTITLLITAINMIRYVFQFFRFQLLQNALNKTGMYEMFNDYGVIVGLFFYEPVCKDPDNCEIYPDKLRFGFFFNIILLFFAVLGYNYLAMVQLYDRSLISFELSEGNMGDLEAGTSRKFSLESEENQELNFDEYLNNIRQFFEDYVNVSLRKEIKGLETVLYYACLFDISIIFFLVMILCVYFWLSIANLLYLLSFLFYFFKVHGSFLKFAFESNLYHRIQEKMNVYRHNFLSYEALTDPNFLPKYDYNRKNFLDDLNIVKVQCLTTKIYYKKVLWKLTTILSVICLFLTFFSQWYSISNMPSDQKREEYIMWGLFLFGTFNCDGKNLLYDIYPYYLFVILNFIEVKSILFLEDNLIQEMKNLNLSFLKTKDNWLLPIKMIREENMISCEKNKKNSISSTLENNEQNLTFKCKIFFANNARSLRHELLMAMLYILEGIYLIVFLINSDVIYNLFSMITLITVVYLSLRTNFPTYIIKILNGCSLVLLMVHYPLFLINNNKITNPREIPQNLQDLLNFNLVDYIFEKSGMASEMMVYIKKFLALGETQYDYTTFFVNSIILYTVQLYFLWMFLALRAVYNCIEKRSIQIENQKTNLLGEYKKWIGTGAKLLTASHSFVYVNIHIIISFLMAFLLIFNNSVFNFVLFVFIMSFLLINELFLSKMPFAKKLKIVIIVLKTIQIYLISLLIARQIAYFPIIIANCEENTTCSIIFSMSIWDKLSCLIILKFALDLMSSKDFTKISNIYIIRKNLRAKLLKICITYDSNDIKLKKWLEKFENKLILKEKVRFVIQKLEHWHAKYFSYDPKIKSVSEKAIEDLRSQSSIKKSQEIFPLKTEGSKGFRLKLLGFLQNKKHKFLFLHPLTLINIILEKNRNIIAAQTLELTDYIFSKYDGIEKAINYLDHLHARLIKTLKHRLENPQTIEFLNISEENYEKFFLNLYEDVKKSLKTELPKNQTKGLGSGKLLIKQPNHEGFLNILDFEPLAKHNGEQPSYFLLWINAFEFCFSFWDVMCYIFVIFYVFWNTGLICFLLPAFSFGFLLIEEKSAKANCWGLLMVFFLSIIICKFWAKMLKIEPEDGLFNIFFGVHTSFYYEFYLIIIISVQINLLKIRGFDKSVISENENIYQTFLRKKLNNDFEDIKKNNEIIQELIEQQEEEVEENPKHSKPSLEDGAFYLRILPENRTKAFLQRQTSFSNGYLEQCNYDTLKGKALKNMELEVMSSILQLKLKNFKSYFFRFFSKHNRKNGKNLHIYILAIQIIIALYIFFLFSKMLEVDQDTSIADSVKYSMFSGRMVLALFFHFSTIFIERLIMLYNPFKNEKLEIKPSFSMFSFDQQVKIHPKTSIKSENMYKTPIFLKYLFHCFLLFLIPYFVLIFIPTHGSNQIKDGKLKLNSYDLFFFMLYYGYFYLSALQIKYGLPDKNKSDLLQRGYSQFQGFMFNVYRIIPFLYEFKLFMDWYFTETALSLVQWIKLEEISCRLFLAKCSSKKFKGRNHGNLVKWWIKFFLGGCSVFLLVLCIFGPMLLFSPLNPIAESNLVQQFSMKMGIMYDERKYFKLFEIENVVDIKIVNDTEFEQEGFIDIPYLEGLDRNEFQRTAFQSYSDNIWGISGPNLEILKKRLKEKISKENDNKFDLQIDYSIKRQRESEWIANTMRNTIDNLTILNIFLSSISNCRENEVIYLPKFFSNTIKINTKSEISLIHYNDILLKDIYLSLVCDSLSNISYWTLSQDQNATQGIFFFTISNQSTSDLLGYSIIGFYIGVVYIIGKLLRNAISNKAVSFLFTDLPDPDSLIRLCESIKIARQEKNHYMEELFYYELMDLLKSPDVVKQITGSSVQTIKEKEKKKMF